MDTSGQPGPVEAIEAAAPDDPSGAGGDSQPPRSGPPRPALIGLGVLAAIGAILLAVFLLRPQPDPVGEASPSPTPSATPEPMATVAPSATELATPDLTANAAPTIPESWTEAAVFAEPGKRYVLGDLVSWSNGLVAVGTLYEEQGRGVFGPPPQHSGRVWRSADGTDWTDATPVGTFVDVELTHLFEAADGALIVIGNTYPEVEPVSAAWESSDGETWSPVELAGIPRGAFVFQVASGARGHVASTSTSADSHPLYSSDGRAWEPTLADSAIYTVAAGEEGFVANVTRDGTEATTGIVASADGLEWLDATEPSGGIFLAASRGGDWLATTTTFADDGSVATATWGSATGLDWSPLGSMPLQPGETAGVDCFETPAALTGLPIITIAATTLAGGCGEGAVLSAGGTYATVDGAEWTRLPFGDHAYAAGAVVAGDRIVVGTDARTSQAEVIGVTFWISEP